LFLPWAICIRSLSVHPVSLRSILIFSFHIQLDHTNCVVTSGFANKIVLIPVFPCASHVSLVSSSVT
jgi:hypothetical protein